MPSDVAETNRLMTAREVADLLGASVDFVYAQARAGRLPCVQLGRLVRFRRESLQRWLIELEEGGIDA